MLLEGDEMYTRFLYTYGKSLLNQKFGTKKVVKEKEFMKFIGQDKKKKAASYMTQKKEEELINPNMSLEEALAIKRDPSKLLDSYQPKQVERYWYEYWEKKKLFHANSQKALETKKTYVMLLPPPNVTGYLHLGHALTSAIEDCLVRLHRMRGYETLYLPGTDHAGIATQTIVEKSLAKQGLTKYDLGREKFMEKVWEWKTKHGNQIDHQLRRVGSSLDFDRYMFTMDDKMQVAVSEAFIRLAEQGLIYRANRLVNWSCVLKTAISDIEVEYMDLEKPIKLQVAGHKGEYEFGYMTYFAYKVENSDEEIVIGTTRLETMLGDVAVAVHSQDKRYKHLHGKYLIHPFIKDRKVAIVLDDDLVDMDFGTGAVKVTPAHDPNDYECGKRHNLKQICIFTDDGKINENGGPYAGMMRYDCRVKMEEDMKKMGLFKKKEINKMRIGQCQRSKDIVEPMLKPQWYLNNQTIKQRMLDVVKNKELEIIPSDFEGTWFQWINNLRDWCISRQIWWGHRCPAYMIKLDGKLNQEDWVFARNPQEALQKAQTKYPNKQVEVEQDPDVLDTWFSSGLFPFSTMGWPDESNPDFQAFYPNTILETGWDILFFWVARMVQFSLLFYDKVPFKYVFLHPIIRDKDGKKMSKSLGNVIDPLEIIEGTTLDNLKSKILEGNLPPDEIKRAVGQKETDFPEGIPECGSDALRFGLLAYMQKCVNINLDVLRIIGYRQFCNKIWQTMKFALPKIPNDIKYTVVKPQSLINQWIINRLNYTIKQVNYQFDDYEFGIATQRFHQFWLYELCDVYLEGIKFIFSDKNQNEELKAETQLTLITILDLSLKLLHPMMPFLSEELWQKLPRYENKSESLSVAPYPQGVDEWKYDEAENKFNFIQDVARQVRQICTASNLPPSARPETFILFLKDKELGQILESEQQVLIALARVSCLKVVNEEDEMMKKCATGLLGDRVKLFVNLKGLVNVDQEKGRLEKRMKEINKLVENLNKKMSQYSAKVPEQVRKEDQEKMKKYESEQALLKEQLSKLE